MTRLVRATRPPSLMISWMNGGNGCAWTALLCHDALGARDEAAVVDDLLDERRERLRLEDGARGLVGDGAGIGVHGDDVAVGDGLGGLGALEDGQAHVDRVAVEDAREALGDHAGDAGGLDGHGGVLAAGAAAEVLVGDHDVAGLHAAHERGVKILEAVLGELGRVRRVEVARRNDHVGVDVAPVAEDGSLELHRCPFCQVPGSWDMPRAQTVASQNCARDMSHDPAQPRRTRGWRRNRLTRIAPCGPPPR